MCHKQLQRCLLLCFLAVSITLGRYRLTTLGFDLHPAAAPLRFVLPLSLSPTFGIAAKR